MMALEDLTDAGAVNRALSEYDALGELAFRKKYGFGSSRGWNLEHGGTLYGAKAIAGAAHGYQFPNLGPLAWNEFHGGVESAKQLRALGFTILEPSNASRNPPWSRDELIVAMDLYLNSIPSLPGPKHANVLEVSDLLNQLAIREGKSRGPKYRNADGVAMKLQNFRKLDPSQNGRGLSGGGHLDAEVWNAFIVNQAWLRATASAIRDDLGLKQETERLPQLLDVEEAMEGAVLTRQHVMRERDSALMRTRKAKAMRDLGRLSCEACGFDFIETYGQRGEGFIECHHTQPLCTLKVEQKTKLADLCLLCANCHRMIHRRPPITVAELRNMLSSSRCSVMDHTK